MEFQVTITAGTQLVLLSPNGIKLSLGTGIVTTLVGYLRNVRVTALALPAFGSCLEKCRLQLSGASWRFRRLRGLRRRQVVKLAVEQGQRVSSWVRAVLHWVISSHPQAAEPDR